MFLPCGAGSTSVSELEALAARLGPVYEFLCLARSTSVGAPRRARTSVRSKPVGTVVALAATEDQLRRDAVTFEKLEENYPGNALRKRRAMTVERLERGKHALLTRLSGS